MTWYVTLPRCFARHSAFFGLLHRRSYRAMGTGLFFVSAKPLALQPRAPASKAVSELVEGAGQQLQTYNVVEYTTRSRTPRLALSVIHDLANFKASALSLPPLQPQAKDPVNSVPNSPLAEAPDSDDGPGLPPELQPVLKESGLPPLPEGLDLSVEDEDGEDLGETTPTDYDALDLKNMPDFDPDQDGEAEYFSDDVLDAWVMLDEECSKGARPRLYESLDISNQTGATIYSKDYDPTPITCKWPHLSSSQYA